MPHGIRFFVYKSSRGLQSNAFKHLSAEAPFFKANGLKYLSPGQRPGSWDTTNDKP